MLLKSGLFRSTLKLATTVSLPSPENSVTLSNSSMTKRSLPLAAVECVGAGVAKEEVVPPTAIEGVVAVPATDLVVEIVAGQPVGVLVALQTLRRGPVLQLRVFDVVVDVIVQIDVEIRDDRVTAFAVELEDSVVPRQ